MPNSLSLISIPDWGKLTGKPSAFPPDLHKTSHQLAGADAIDCAGLAGRVNYVDRGDPGDADWTQATLTIDATWRDLDCSAIVPAGATAIYFSIILYSAEVAKSLAMRKNGNTNVYNATWTYTQAEYRLCSADVIVACDADRKIEYRITISTLWDIAITVRGWFI